MKKVTQIIVRLKDRRHKIFIGRGLLLAAGKIWAASNLPKRAVVITNPEIKNKYGGLLKKSLEKSDVAVFFILIPPGEKFKNLDTVSRIYDSLISLKIERGDAIVALGGGVVGDLAGFVGATYLRGLAFVQIPTTLLAMVDSAIGGKVGVNHSQGKNLIGAFYQPKAILMDLDTLNSLPASEIRNGLAEVVKYGMIRDEKFFHFLENSAKFLRRPPDFSNKKQIEIYLKIVSTCAAIKARVVEQDEKEKYLRMILNFGHTIGHGIEAAGIYQTYTHGEAVALGMLAATLVARQLKLADGSIYLRLSHVLKKLNLPVKIKKRINPRLILQALTLDKKIKNKKIRLVLPGRIGLVEIRENIPPATIIKAIGELII